MSVRFQIEDYASNQHIQQWLLEKKPTRLHQCIEAQAARTPHYTALEFAGEAVSYLELNRRADQVANYLIGKGIRAGDFVAVYQEKSADLFICLLGVSKAGAAYVPIDPGFTSDHAASIIAEWEPELILTSKQLSKNLTPVSSEKLVLIDEKKESLQALAGRKHFFDKRSITPDSTSHVIFKTGPAGALESATVNHREAINFVCSLVSVYGLDAEHRCYQDPSVAFDVAVEEIWAMLSVGATIVFGQEDVSGSPEAKARFLSKQLITLYSTVPEVLKEMNHERSTLDVVIVGGQLCPSELAVGWALKIQRLVSLKHSHDRFPSFSIEQETRAASRPRLLRSRAS